MVKKKSDQQAKRDFIKFLGTAGARFVMIKQLRASGGIWVSYKGTNILIDPGPGSLVRCSASKPKLDPSSLDAVILTHKHLDHSGDINVMIEAMTEGGFKKRGLVFAPADSLDSDPVIFNYLRHFPEEIRVLKERQSYSAGAFSFTTSMKHIHPVETYGLRFVMNGVSVGLLTDTKYFKELGDFYKADILIIGVVLAAPRAGIDHLSMADVETLIKDLKPGRAVLTHFGMSMLKARPHELVTELTQRSGVEVVAAYDGMTMGF
jgi:phosphoribosyl 1,2-cyclic phosphodiesterase